MGTMAMIMVKGNWSPENFGKMGLWDMEGPGYLAGS